MGDYPTALQDVERGISLGAANDPHNEKILRYHEALLLTRTGQFEEALQAYTRFVRPGASDPELFVAIGLAGLRAPLLPRDVPEDKQEAYSAAGHAAYDLMTGDSQTGDQAFRQAFAQYPTTPNLRYLYAYLLLTRDPAAAAEQLRQELNVAPANDAALVLIAWAEILQSDFQTALPYAEKAVQLDPDLPLGQLEVGRSLAETGDPKDGLMHLETALQLQPDNLEVHLALVSAYSKLDRPEDARRERLLCLKMSQQEAGDGPH